MTELEHLAVDIRCDGIFMDGSPISDMKRLRTLYMGDTAFVDLGFLKGLPELTELSVSAMQEWDRERREDLPLNADTIFSLTDLEYLHITTNNNSRFFSVTGISTLINLTSLHISIPGGQSVQKIENLDFLKGMSKLRYIYIWRNEHNEIDLSALAGLKDLTSVDISYMSLSDSNMSVLTEMKQLRELRFDNSETLIAESDKDKLKQALPNCSISF